MKTVLFDFVLPADRIALRPAIPRGGARLMVVRPQGPIEHRQVKELPGILEKGDILSVNDSRVIPARLRGTRVARSAEGAAVAVEVTLHKREGEGRYRALAQPARRLRPSDTLLLAGGLEARVLERVGPEVSLAFNRAGADLDAAIAASGEMPLPPYIAKQRPADAQDATDYQTVYADRPGSVAAPTAGLHFTPALLERLRAAGVTMTRTTLHVGAGTFLPVSVEDTQDHRMHAEWAMVPAEAAAALNAAHAGGSRVVAVGTTALRTLESAATPDGLVQPMNRDTDIFITPGYRFRAVDALFTNFHLPCSTLFMLVCAFMGTEIMQAAYAEAIAKDYRFYSYGDACLLFRPR